jgi:hypothetical protein
MGINTQSWNFLTSGSIFHLTKLLPWNLTTFYFINANNYWNMHTRGVLYYYCYYLFQTADRFIPAGSCATKHTNSHITCTWNTRISQNTVTKKKQISTWSYINNEGRVTANEYNREKGEKWSSPCYRPWRPTELSDRDSHIVWILCFSLCLSLSIYIYIYIHTHITWVCVCVEWPPLWSSGQSSCLVTQRSRVRFPTRPHFLSSTVVLERGPLSICEDKWEATWKKSSGWGLENWD